MSAHTGVMHRIRIAVASRPDGFTAREITAELDIAVDVAKHRIQSMRKDAEIRALGRIAGSHEKRYSATSKLLDRIEREEARLAAKARWRNVSLVQQAMAARTLLERQWSEGLRAQPDFVSPL